IVVFTDGEAHDSVASVTAQAQRLHAEGIRLILVAEGGRNPARIPVRDEHGSLLGYQKDENGSVIETSRRDDVLGAAADAAHGPQGGRRVVQRGDGGAGRLRRRDRSGEPGARRRLARPRLAVPRAL